MHVRPDTRVAYGSVQYKEKSYYGRVILRAVKRDDHWVVDGTYPAYGVDPVEFEIGTTKEEINSIQKFRAWAADNWPQIEVAVAAARKRRYALRREFIPKAD